MGVFFRGPLNGGFPFGLPLNEPQKEYPLKTTSHPVSRRLILRLALLGFRRAKREMISDGAHPGLTLASPQGIATREAGLD